MGSKVQKAQIERRKTPRFEVDGAQVSYWLAQSWVMPLLFWRRNKNPREFGPVVNLSLGGVRFLSQSLPPADSDITLQMLVPGLQKRVLVKGKVAGMVVNPGKSYRYQIRVKFNEYRDPAGKNHNPLKYLSRLASIERRYLAQQS